MKKIYLLLITFMGAYAVHAQVPLSEGSSTYAQDFDNIGTAAAATLPANWRVSVSTEVRTVGAFADAGTATTQRAGNNMSTTAANGIYNYGAGDAATATDRAVGGLSSASASRSVNVFLHVVNNGGSDISYFTLNYDIEKYRNGSNPAGFTVALLYSFDGVTWTEAPPVFRATFAPGPDNAGSADAPSGFTRISDQVLTISLPVGGNMYFAWNYSVSSGTTTSNAIALGLDNVSIAAAFSSVLPLRLADFRVAQQGNAVALHWDALNEANMDKHDIEKSTDGSSFSVIGTVKANNAAASKYTYLDATPQQGQNFYRLRFTNLAGEFTYSQVLRINLGVGATDIVISPNPVTNGYLNLQYNNLEKGKYFIRLVNNDGRTVYSRSLVHAGGSSTEVINLPALGKGVYMLQLSNGPVRINKRVMVN